MFGEIKVQPEVVSRRRQKECPLFKLPGWLKKCKLLRLSDPEGMKAWENLLKGPKQAIGVDTETNSKNARKAKLLMVSVAYSESEALLLEFRVPKLSAALAKLDLISQACTWKPVKNVEILAKQLYEVCKLHEVVMQNKIYDERVLDRELGPFVGGVFRADRDTMLAAYLEDGSQPTGLKDLIQNKFALPVIQWESVNFVDPEQRLFYACQDAIGTLRLDGYFRRKKVYEMMLFPVEMEVADVIKDMEEVGVLIDQAEVKRQQIKVGGEIVVLEKKIYEYAGRKFKIDSTAQVGKVLFEDIGLASHSTTATGRYSTRATVLEAMKNVHPIVSSILEYRHKQKLKSQYLDGIYKYIEEDGRIHASYLQTVVPTGRLACKDPNNMQVPLDDIRKCYVASPGFILINADYKQIEFRLLASESKCQPALRALAAGKDTHRMCALVIFGKSEVTKEERDDSKTQTFGIVYGMEDWGLAARLSISRSEARDRMDRWFRLWRGIREWIAKEQREGIRRGGSRTIFGRHRTLPDLRSREPRVKGRALRNVINDRIQGGAADIAKMRMKRVNDRIKAIGGRTLIFNHDSMLFEVPIEREEEGVKVSIEGMEWKRRGFADMDVEVKVGQNWGELKEYPVQGNNDKIIEKPKETKLSKKQVAILLQKKLLACRACTVRKEAKAPVPFKGDLRSQIMFVGRNPGGDEDEQGLPFVGRGGQLLNKYIKGMGLVREKIYITNLLKCYTTDNRVPNDEEVRICRDLWLKREIKLMRPKVILLFGNQCIRAILGKETPSVNLVHGEVFERKLFGGTVRLVALYHPGYCLRNDDAAERAVQDIKELKPKLEQWLND